MKEQPTTLPSLLTTILDKEMAEENSCGLDESWKWAKGRVKKLPTLDELDEIHARNFWPVLI